MTVIAPVIETSRLRLRPYELGDLDDLADIRRRPDVMRYLYQGVQDRAAVAAVLERRATSQRSLEREGDGMVLAVVLREIGQVIGDVSMRWVSETHRQGEIGFTFHPDYHGKGYASEAARELLRLGFDQVGFHRIEGRCDARNDASARLMARLGMRREAHYVENEWFKGEWGSELVYAMLEGEWRARSGAECRP
jgi:RimJ/RimL family protein N-acetyltransferase